VTITASGTVISNLAINGTLVIRADNVTVRNVKIVAPSGANSAINTGYANSGIVFDHVEIDGGKRKPSVPGIIGGGYTATALNIHGTGDAIDLSSGVTVKDSYIHDLYVAPGDHTDGIQSAGTDDDLIQHCTIDATLAGGGFANSALIIGADLANMGTVTISGNLLGGGSYTAYAGADPGYSSGKISFINNRFARSAQYGSCSFKPSSGHPITFTGNVMDDTTAAVNC
jgi:hypothetical protein